MLENTRIAKKMSILTGAILSLMLLLGGWGIFGLNHVVENGRMVAEGTHLRGEILQREVDHLNWAQKVSAYLTSDHATELDVQIDHTKCGFGKWYYGEGRKKAEGILPQLKEPLAAIEEPHHKLHASAKKIKEVTRQTDIGQDATIGQDAASANLTGKKAAVAIFANETQVHLKEVQALLSKMNTLAKENIISDEEMIAGAQHSRNAIIVIALIALGVGGILVFFICRSITAPLSKAVSMIQEMAKGHVHGRLNMHRGDEIGDMTRAMDSFADTLEKEVVVALDKLANGDLTFLVTPKDDQDAIGISLKKTGDDLNKLITEVLVATDQVSVGSGQVSDASQALSQGATEQAASLEEVTSSMTEMASQTKLNAENAAQANQLAGQTKKAAENGNAQMDAMLQAMTQINEASQNISKIIKVIDEIAFQTNLLALNAAVEAARAGRHGKGFAVVAEEVRNLAARSAKAAKETAELIEGTVEKTNNGTRIAESTSQALAEIVNSVTKVTDLVGEIAAASNEQAQGINQTTQALGQIDQVTQQNTASAEQSAAASEELSSQAAHMKEMMSRFKVRGMEQGYRPQQANHKIAPRKGASQQTWGAAPRQPVLVPPRDKEQKPSDIIALNDREFGKY
ncbi:MAG: methyl-accepting chemotaxis protein [Desulfobulbaceae bacterium]|nr:methyl-accepting chemotaxis protein [Desulfobulbaceae bacterium]